LTAIIWYFPNFSWL